MSPEYLATLRTYEHWDEVQADGIVFFRGDRVGYAGKGLGVYRPGTSTWHDYPLFRLALAAGWYMPLAGDGPPPEGLRGLGRGGGKVWMGSNGLGIVTLDLKDGSWSRHDAKATPLPGVHSIVLHADDDYVFVASGGPSGRWRELPDIRSDDQLGPAIEVYSIRQQVWLRLRAVPGKNVVSFGWTDSKQVSVRCDNRRMQWLPEVPLESCTRPQYIRPRPDLAGYEGGREFNEPGAPFRFVLRREELDTAFTSLPPPRAAAR